MNKTHKFTLICCCLIAAGLVLMGIGYATGGRVWGIGIGNHGLWVNTPNSSGKRITYIKDTTELDDFTSMDIKIHYGNAVIEPSDHFGVSYCVSSEYDFSAEVKDGCLMISEEYPVHFGLNHNSDISFFSFGTGRIYENEYVKIQVPTDASFEEVKLINSYGNVSADNLNTRSLELTAEYGDVSLINLASGMAAVTLESGSLELDGFSDGKLTISDEYGNVILKNAESTMADITLESGSLELDGFSGEKLTIENDYGNASFKNISAEDISISMESGKFTSTGLRGNTLLLKQQYGHVTLEDSKFAKSVDIFNESGNTDLSDMTAASLKLESDYGKISGEMVSAAACSMILESGDCTVNKFDTDNLDIRSYYGNVKLSVTNPVPEYALQLSTNYGKVKINGEDMGTSYKSLEPNEKSLVINCESGNITLLEEK